MGHESVLLLKGDPPVTALKNSGLYFPLAALTQSWPPTLRTFSISSSNTTMTWRTVSLSMVRWDKASSIQSRQPSPKRPSTNFGLRRSSRTTRVSNSALPLSSIPALSSCPKEAPASKVIFPFARSFFFADVFRLASPRRKRLLSVGSVLSQLRIMSGSAVPSAFDFV